MKFDKPATQNPTDRKKVIGKATDRYEGKLKTTGTAKYAYEWHDIAPKPAYGYVLGAAIAKGRIASIDTAPAESSAGVFAVVSAQNSGPLGQGDFNAARLLAGPEVQHYHQAVAIVVARTFEEARSAAGKIQSALRRRARRVRPRKSEGRCAETAGAVRELSRTPPSAILTARLRQHQ